MKASELIATYYSAFNRRDQDSLISLLSDEVIHDINQGAREIGLSAFRDFLASMNFHYVEMVKNLIVMISNDGKRAAAEFTIDGIYKTTVKGLPKASGQKYQITVGAFFSIENGKISRVSNHYNLQDWLQQVSQ